MAHMAFDVNWQPKAWWNRYRRGLVVRSTGVPFTEIWERVNTGQLRFYTDDDMDGATISVNGGRTFTMHQRGRHGRLYISDVARPGDADYVRPTS